MSEYQIRKKPLKIMVMGPQGSGKSTQVELLARVLGLPMISTGKICREAVASGTELGQKVKTFLDSGKYVPDDIILEVIKQAVAKQEMSDGFIGEGFPRTLFQVETLEGLFTVVFNINLNDEVSLKRLTSRRVCKNCGATYNLITKPPKNDGICDNCLSQLVTREDDIPELVKTRLNEYHEQNDPVREHYRKAGTLEEIDGNRPIEPIFEDIVERLEKRGLVNA